MSTRDPIAEFLTKIRNAFQAKHPDVTCPRSNLKEEICRILKREHFIKDYEVIKDARQGMIKISLAYGSRKQPFTNGLKRISRQGLRQYQGYKEFKRVHGGLGIRIVSTPKGILTGDECIEAKVGGEVICEVW